MCRRQKKITLFNSRATWKDQIKDIFYKFRLKSDLELTACFGNKSNNDISANLTSLVEALKVKPDRIKIINAIHNKNNLETEVIIEELDKGYS